MVKLLGEFGSDAFRERLVARNDPVKVPGQGAILFLKPSAARGSN